MAKKQTAKQTAGTVVSAAPIERVHRSKLEFAGYNPRKMAPEARRRLEQSLLTFGFVDPPVWNRRSGRLVGGHHRIAVWDRIQGGKDYELNVAVVDLDDGMEQALNVALNNPTMMGEFDLEKLADLVVNQKLDYEAAGFTAAEMYQSFGEAAVMHTPENVQAMADTIAAYKQEYGKYTAQGVDRSDEDFYAVAVFRDGAERARFAAACGLADNRYLDGRTLPAVLINAVAASLLDKPAMRALTGQELLAAMVAEAETMFPSERKAA